MIFRKKTLFTIITLLATIMSNYPTDRQASVQLAIDSFSHMCNTEEGYRALRGIMKHDPGAAQAFVQPAIDNFSQMCSTKYGSWILDEIMEHYPDAYGAFVEPAYNNASQMFEAYLKSRESYGCSELIDMLHWLPDEAESIEIVSEYYPWIPSFIYRLFPRVVLARWALKTALQNMDY